MRMTLQDILFSQGFGTRRTCAGLIQQGRVAVLGKTVLDSVAQFDPQALGYCVQGQDWVYQERAYLMLHKPSGTECSHKPSSYPSVYSLLPAPLRMRPQKSSVQGVQAVGRLDQDSTGLLLLTDDGKFIHRMSSPRHHVPKVYQVTTRHAIEQGQIERLLLGVVLDDDPVAVRAAACAQLDEHRLDLTLIEGKYHQVKRMLAAVGNRVEALHRSRIGALNLPDDLAAGQWRWLNGDELRQVVVTEPAAGSP